MLAAVRSHCRVLHGGLHFTIMEKPNIAPEWLTLKDVCAWLRISEPGVRRLLARGDLPGAVKVGGLWRVHAPTLREKFLNSGEGPP